MKEEQEKLVKSGRFEALAVMQVSFLSGRLDFAVLRFAFAT